MDHYTESTRLSTDTKALYGQQILKHTCRFFLVENMISLLRFVVFGIIDITIRDIW